MAVTECLEDAHKIFELLADRIGPVLNDAGPEVTGSKTTRDPGEDPCECVRRILRLEEGLRLHLSRMQSVLNRVRV